MTHTEVQALLGSPPLNREGGGEYTPSGVVTYHYWQGEEGGIVVYLDGDGRVIDTYVTLPPTWLDQLRERLGIDR
jgi:hypothetical protein